MGVLAATVALGALAFELSSSPTIVPIELMPGATVEVPVDRLRAHALRPSLTFERSSWSDTRSELGTWSTRGDPRELGYLEFSNPGVPILLRVRVDAAEVDYEAMPADGHSATSVTRTMVPRVEDSDPRRYPWGRDHATRRHTLPAGRSHLVVTVLEVGDRLRGERIRLVVSPPVTWKATAPGYSGIWWFVFWPVYGGIVLVYAVILWWWGPHARFARCPPRGLARLGAARRRPGRSRDRDRWPRTRARHQRAR